MLEFLRSLFRRSITSIAAKAHDLGKLKQITSILVVDDDPNAFPDVPTLRSEGYNITEWTKVESLSQLEAGTFDVIVLDISGVAAKWGPRDGLEVLKLLKETNPGQYVIAFSGQRSVHELEDFWKLSDAQLKKPVTVADCKRKLDEALYDRANVLHYWSRIHDRLAACGVTDRQIALIEDRIVRQAKAGDTSPTRLKKLVGSCLGNEKVQDLVLTLAIKLITAALI